jgi:proline dehydrogenase
MPSTAAHARTAVPDLNDLRIAFAASSDADLARAYWLFRAIGNPAVNTLGRIITQTALALRLPVGWAIKPTIFRHFCGGQTIDESLRTAERLAHSGIGTILDYSVEGQEDDDSLDRTRDEILRTIAAAKGHDHVPFSVFKPTGVSPVHILEKVSAGTALSDEDAREWQLVQGRVERICQAAAEAGVPVLIDAEDSWYQPAIDALATAMMERFNRQRAIVFNTIQLYRHDRLAFLHAAQAAARSGGYHLGVKLVRGAYLEKERARAAEQGYPSPIQPTKAATDRDYDAALRFCIDHVDQVSVLAGTHNEQSALLLAQLMDERGLARNDRRVWFAQLLGMSDNISSNLAHAGFNVAKYVPYGPVRAVLPYLIRRAQENTSVAGQMGRELKMIVQERKRRRGA